MTVDLKDDSLRSACTQAVVEVLETMFFELPLDEPAESSGPSGKGCAAQARFDGSFKGTLTVVLSDELPGTLATSFLGLEDEPLGAAERESVVIELANVLCGATMSRMEPSGRLRIEQPVIVEPQPECGGPWLSFPLESGRLDVQVYYGVEP